MNTLLSVAIFLGLGFFFVFFNLLTGKLLRPRVPMKDKATAYECGELPVGDSRVQFDLRFYIVALVFLVFDVEVALLYPFATLFQRAEIGAGGAGGGVTFPFRGPALVELAIFFGLLLLGYAYLWRFGYLEWVRGVVTGGREVPRTEASRKISEAARRDPEVAEARV